MENSSPDKCPNCQSKLSGLMSKNRLLDERQITFLKEYSETQASLLCFKCGKTAIQNAKSTFNEHSNIIENNIKAYYRSFPVLTIQPSESWQFESLGTVTAQSTMTNKVQTSLLDSLLNVNQNVVDLNRSANSGEQNCMELLRQKTYALGGNAIVALDIDYSEFGLKGELMLVCMAGTAIKVSDSKLVNTHFFEMEQKFSTNMSHIEKLKSYNDIYLSLP